MIRTAMYASTLDEIISMIPVQVNMSDKVNFDHELENKNNKPYVYYDEKKGVLKVFRVNKKNLDTLLTVYDYGLLQSPHVSNFEANLFLDKDRDAKVIKALPSSIQKEMKGSFNGHVSFKNATEFMTLFLGIRDKITWVF